MDYGRITQAPSGGSSL